MKRNKIYFLLCLLIAITNISIITTANVIYATFTAGNLTITSYSHQWDEEKLQLLYQELLNNFHGNEFNLLNAIYLYPNSPHGVNGYYYEDIFISENGNYVIGNNSYIELYNANKYNTIESIAPNLSHEYGHHYTICNILNYEDKYYSDWAETEYAKIRELSNYPVVYTYNDVNYIYRWDVTEIAAEDYVQLLGSTNAKLSVDYKDTLESLEEDISERYYTNDTFNLMPQLNPNIPLAADVKGLYGYMMKISGYNSTPVEIQKKPEITSFEEIDIPFNSKQYKITWSEALGNSPFEYTVIMYPDNNPYAPIPIKTVKSSESLEAVFGSGYKENDDSTVSTIQKSYEGNYYIQIYTKDNKNFIYASEPYKYNFGDYEEVSIKPNPPIDVELYETTTESTTIYDIDDKPTNNLLKREIALPPLEGTIDNVIENKIKFVIEQKKIIKSPLRI